MSEHEINNVRDYLKAVSGVYGDRPSLERVVLEHGRNYTWAPLPDGIEPGLLKECFANAGREALMADHGLRYVEGYAMGFMLPVHHAWLTDGEHAFEVTWRDGGNECGFCVDGEVEVEDDDEDAVCGEFVPCPMCDGTGTSDHEHRPLEGTEYVGIEVPTDLLRKTVMTRNRWTYFSEPTDVEEWLDTLGEEKAA